MHPTVVSVISLLVALMHTADAGLAEDCATQYPAKSCGGTEWQWLGEGRCMKVISEALSNEDAQKSCKSKGGDLVSLHDYKEYNRLVCHLYRISKGQRTTVWIGARRGDQGFFWSDGSGIVTVDNWAPFQPDNLFFREYCVEINYWDWGLWNDRNCNDEVPYVCAKKM